ncbi:hypothetical protein CO177_00305, partial [Candidatus Wolfebacteria bacterium CG_4_9_14_3_um_filter_37_9]
MKRPIFLFFIIILLAIVAVFFVYPPHKIIWGTSPKFFQSFDWLEKKLPWKLGLDLVGGTHLIYEINMEQVDGIDRDSVISGLRDVIEKR